MLITASGNLGNSIHQYYENIIPITRKELNLKNPNLDVLNQDFSTCIISAALTNIDYCEQNKEELHEIKMGTIKIIKKLDSLNKKIIFVSTDYVFDGIKGDYTEFDKPNPINQYGKSKSDIEFFIDFFVRNYLIVRIGKQFSYDKDKSNFIRDMIIEMKNGTTNVAYDQIMTPTLVDDTAKGIIRLIQNNNTGIIHIANQSWNRLTLAKSIENKLNLSDTIHEISIKSIGKAPRPLDTSLNCSKFKHMFPKFKFTPLEKSIERILNET